MHQNPSLLLILLQSDLVISGQRGCATLCRTSLTAQQTESQNIHHKSMLSHLTEDLMAAPRF